MSPLIILQLPAHLLRVVSAQHVTTETPLPCQVFLYLFLVERDALGLKARDAESRHKSSATLSASVSSRCPSGWRLSSTPSRCSSQSSFFSTPGITGAGERMPCCVAFHFTTSLPSWVAGPPLAKLKLSVLLEELMRHLP